MLNPLNAGYVSYCCIAASHNQTLCWLPLHGFFFNKVNQFHCVGDVQVFVPWYPCLQRVWLHSAEGVASNQTLCWLPLHGFFFNKVNQFHCVGDVQVFVPWYPCLQRVWLHSAEGVASFCRGCGFILQRVRLHSGCPSFLALDLPEFR